jgi:crotonobetainyl-CoA:carnitine CoA-transferase CaiB-like acyl-CoA transferase
VRTLGEILEHPHVRARGFLSDVEAPELAKTATVVGAGFRFAHDSPRFQGRVSGLGEHTDTVLAELSP